MARTNKKKQRVNKNRSSSNSVAIKFRNPRAKISFNDAKELGIIIPHENPDGNTYHRFTKGRKACWETKCKFDPDGYRFYKWKGSWQVTKPPMPPWVRRRLSKI